MSHFNGFLTFNDERLEELGAFRMMRLMAEKVTCLKTPSAEVRTPVEIGSGDVGPPLVPHRPRLRYDGW